MRPPSRGASSEGPDADATLAGEQSGDKSGSPARSREDDEAPPERLGHYVLLDRLGAGAMGTVHAAYDTKLDRKVALKLLHAHRSEHAQRRLVREAQAMARLSHPNIVQIYEIGELGEHGELDGGALAFIVMEFVDGVTLRRWFTQQQRSRREILAVMDAAGRGLAAAHAQGLVHRDFKPDNVMVRSDGRVLVMDFGLARGRQGQQDESGERTVSMHDGAEEIEFSISLGTFSELSHDLTATGAIMGTPAYMAPEQFFGREADARVDQFAFCVSLWEALYRQRPFAGPTVAQLSRAVTSGEISSPPRGEVPGWLHAVLLRGLSVDPSERWPSMTDLLDALQRDPTRRRRVLTLGGVTLLVLVGSIVGWQWQREHVREQAIAACEVDGQAIASEWNDDVRSTLEHTFVSSNNEIAASLWAHAATAMDAYASEWTTLRTRSCLDAQVERTLAPEAYELTIACLDERRETVAGVLDAWAEADSTTLQRASMAVAGLPPLSTCTNATYLAQRRTPPDDLKDQVARLEARRQRANGLQRAGEYEQALTQLRALEQDTNALGWKPLSAEVSLVTSEVLQDLGKWEDARVAAEQALFDAIAEGHDLLALEATIELVDIVGWGLTQHEAARRWKRLATAMLDRLELRDTLIEATLADRNARLSISEGLFEQSLSDTQRAVELRERLLGPQHLLVAISLNSMGNSLWELGRYEEALAIHRRALRIREETLGENHPAVASSYNNMGLVLWDMGNYEGALEALRRSLAIWTAAVGPKHVDVATGHNNIALVLLDQGKLDEALESFSKAREIWEAELGPDHADVGLVTSNIGLVLNQQGKHELALETHRRSLEIREKTLGLEHPITAMSHNNIGQSLLDLGRRQEARASFERALAIQRAALEAPHPDIALALTNIGRITVLEGDLDGAEKLLQEALEMREAKLTHGHPSIADSLYGLGDVAFRKGEHARSKELFERSLAIQLAAGVAPVAQASTCLMLGRVLWEMGEHEAARARVREAEQMLITAGDPTDDLSVVRTWQADPDRANKEYLELLR